MEDPCKNCDIKEWYANRFDMHYYGDNCPYHCKPFDKYRQEKQNTDNRNNETK